MAELLRKEKCHSIHFTGDIIYDKGLKNRHDKKFFSKFWDHYGPLTEIDHRPTLYVVLGNHDHEGSVEAWVELSQKHPKLFFPSPYYLVKMNDVCLTHFDSRFWTNYLMRYNQKTWMKEIKGKDLKDCSIKIAVGHHPYNSSGVKHSNSTGLMRKTLKDTVLGVYDFYISGHEHLLSDEGIKNGTHLLISGAGGRRDDGYNGGFLVMEISGTTAKYDFRRLPLPE